MRVRLTSSVDSTRSSWLGFGIFVMSGSDVFRGYDMAYDVLHDRLRDMTLSEFRLEFNLDMVVRVPERKSVHVLISSIRG